MERLLSDIIIVEVPLTQFFWPQQCIAVAVYGLLNVVKSCQSLKRIYQINSQDSIKVCPLQYQNNPTL